MAYVKRSTVYPREGRPLTVCAELSGPSGADRRSSPEYNAYAKRVQLALGGGGRENVVALLPARVSGAAEGGASPVWRIEASEMTASAKA